MPKADCWLHDGECIFWPNGGHMDVEPSPRRDVDFPRCNRCDGLLFGGKCPAPACQEPFGGDVQLAYEYGYEAGYGDAEADTESDPVFRFHMETSDA